MPLPHIYALTDTRWSNAGNTYNGIWLDINNGAGGAAVGAAASRIFRLTNNGAALIGIDLNGQIIIETNSGGLTSAAGQSLVFNVSGNSAFALQNVTPRIACVRSDGAFAWSSTGNPNDPATLLLFQDASDTLALRRDTNAQAFNIYQTFTNSSNYQRWTLGFDGGGGLIQYQFAGTGINQAIRISTGAPGTKVYLNVGAAAGGGIGFSFGDDAANIWSIRGVADGGDGAFIAFTDNTYDIGRLNANRPRNIYAGTNVRVDGGYYFGTANLLFLSSIDTLTIAQQSSPFAAAYLAVDGNNILAQRNGTNAQEFRVYNTFTDSSNYEYGNIRMISGNRMVIQYVSAGTGSPRDISIVGPSGKTLRFGASGNENQWQLNSSGHFVTPTDNTQDIGQPAATRPRNVYISQAQTFGVLTFGSISASVTPAEGMLIGCSTAATVAAGVTVAASGTGHALLYYDGTQWKACN